MYLNLKNEPHLQRVVLVCFAYSDFIEDVWRACLGLSQNTSTDEADTQEVFV